MSIKITPEFLDRLTKARQDECRNHIYPQMRSAMGERELSRSDQAEFDRFFDEFWHQAIDIMELDDCALVAKYAEIVLSQHLWSQNELYAAYVAAMLDGDRNEYDEGVLAVWQNVIQQHYPAE